MKDIPIKLSKRQKQLLGMLEKGMSNKEIADQLELSEHTIKVHFWRLFQRINVTSRGQALKWWHDNQPTGIHSPFAPRLIQRAEWPRKPRRWAWTQTSLSTTAPR